MTNCYPDAVTFRFLR